MQEFIYKNEIIFYQINETKTNCTIFDSYRVTSKKFMIAFVVFLMNTEASFLKRSRSSYIHEWIAHNWLYSKHIYKTSTKDTDLCINESLWRRIGYWYINKFCIIKY